MEPPAGLPAPSAHALALAGVPLADGRPPLVEALAATEVVVVVSRSRDPEREVHLDACRRDRVPVVQRPSGGGAVVLAPGVVVASALHAASADRLLPDPYFAHFCAAVSAALHELGVEGVTRRGTSDLTLGDRKIAGTSLRVWRARVLFQVSVLVDPDLSLLDRYLPEPSRAPAYRAGRRHREFVTSLHEAGVAVGRQVVAAALAAVLLGPPRRQAP
jgi:lipoate-protein ligase A